MCIIIKRLIETNTLDALVVVPNSILEAYPIATIYLIVNSIGSMVSIRRSRASTMQAISILKKVDKIILYLPHPLKIF